MVKISVIAQTKRPKRREINQKDVKKCEIELLNKHYNVLTVSQRDFVDKTFKGYS